MGKVPLQSRLVDDGGTAFRTSKYPLERKLGQVVARMPPTPRHVVDDDRLG